MRHVPKISRIGLPGKPNTAASNVVGCRSRHYWCYGRPVEVATYLLNEKRDWVQNVESRNDTQVIMIANSALETPHYDVRRVRDDQVELP